MKRRLLTSLAAVAVIGITTVTLSACDATYFGGHAPPEAHWRSKGMCSTAGGLVRSGGCNFYRGHPAQVTVNTCVDATFNAFPDYLGSDYTTWYLVNAQCGGQVEYPGQIVAYFID